MQPTPFHIPKSYPCSGSPKRFTGGVCRRPHYPYYSPSISAFLSPSFDLLPLHSLLGHTLVPQNFNNLPGSLQFATATVASRYGDLSLPQPFEIYSRPDLPTALLKTFGDGNSAMVNTPAGTVKVKVVDQHGNPLSNIPVTFTAKAAVSQGSLPLPASTRNIEFYRKEDCAIVFPLPGDCGTVSAFTQVSAHYGARIETLLGNTLNTRYTVAATAPGLPAVAFSLYSLGDMDAGAYAAQIFIEQLITVNEQGVAVNAAKAGDTLATPLSAAQ